MRILLVNDVCWSGGVESQMAALAGGLADLAYDVCAYFYTLGPGTQLFDRVCDYSGQPAANIGEVVCDYCPDVICANLSTVKLGLIRTLERIGYRGGLALVCHGSVFEYDPPLGVVSAVVAVSEHVAGKVRDKLGVEPVVIHNGIDTDVFTVDGPELASDCPVLLWVGRSDDPNKDFAGFAACAAVMVGEGWRVWVADGANSPELNTLSQWIGESCAVFRDATPEKMAEIYRGVGRSGGCMLSTSKSEAFGIAAVEAMACGCPVVAPRVGGLPEIISDGENGLVYDRDSGLGRFYEKLKILSDDDLRQNIVQNARDRAMLDFTREKMVSAYEELLSSLAKQGKCGWRIRKSISKLMVKGLKVGRRLSN